MPLSDESTVIYDINAENRIASVSANWDAFARANHGEGILFEAVRNHPLLEFIDGEEAQYLYTMLLGRARQIGRLAPFPYRCDSPNRRRFMEMEIEAVDHGGIRFYSRTLREEPRERVRLLEPDAPRSERFLLICSMCKKIRMDETKTWEEVERAVAALDLFDCPRLPKLTHGLCLSCDTSLRERFGLPPGSS